MTWRLLDTPALDGATNMAVDVWLMERARRTGESVLRTYRWSRPTLSLGRNQAAAGLYRRDDIARRGIDVVRRPTGGRAILHWRELTYSVTAPSPGQGSLRADYSRVNDILIQALASLGVAATVAGATATHNRPTERPCFAEPSPGEIVVRAGERSGKVVGSAQVREGGAWLQHGSILLHDDQELLVDLTRTVVTAPQAVSLSEALEREVEATSVRDALFGALRSSVDPDAQELEFAGLREAAAALEPQFRDSLWTWSR